MYLFEIEIEIEECTQLQGKREAMNVYGENIKVSIFGESHGEGIGAVIDGLPAGETIDMEEVSFQMARRAPGGSPLATSRREPDSLEVLSGIFNGKTTGAPVAGLIRNTNTRSRDYTPNIPRPGHADLTAFIKYDGNADYRGGGHFSGRITAALVFAGALSRQILARRGICMGAHVLSIKNVRDERFTGPTAEQLISLSRMSLPVLNEAVISEMEGEILGAREAGDSVGGIIECSAVGVPAGLGSPFFGSMESRIASMMYSVPAVKGVQFGAGFEMTEMSGLDANDPIRTDGRSFFTETNNNGGINGGITNGMPVVFSVAVKPTPSVSAEQRTVNLESMENVSFTVTGRHDPCIVIRAVPVVESGLAIALLDAMVGEGFL